MKAICSYCTADLGERPPLDDPGVTHGMCDDCGAYFERQWDGLALEEWLGAFEAPVIVVNDEGRLLAANDGAQRMLGRSGAGLRGLRGGEAMECAWARHPEGCGNTVHCRECTIRRTVMDTLASGRGAARVPATLRRADSSVRLLISTELSPGPTVTVRIAPAA